MNGPRTPASAMDGLWFRSPREYVITDARAHLEGLGDLGRPERFRKLSPT
jgi:hypothetical protein